MPLLEPNTGDKRSNFILLEAQTPSMLAHFARSGSQSHPPLKFLDPPVHHETTAATVLDAHIQNWLH